MGGPQECYGFPPANYRGQSMPKSIEFNGISALTGFIFLSIYLVYDYRSRRVALSGKAPPGEEIKVNIVYPIFLYFVMIWMFGNQVFGNFMNIILFEGLRSDGNPNAKEYACYIQWWSKGAPLYGNLGIIITPCIALYICLIFATLYPKGQKGVGKVTNFLLHCCPEQTKGKETVNYLLIGVSDGSACVHIQSHLYSEDSQYKDRIKILLADKFGVEHGEQSGIDKKVVEGNMTYNNCEEGTTYLDLPCYRDWSSPEYLNLQGVADKSQDFVQVKALFSSFLDVMLDERNSYMRKSRYVNAFIEIHRVLKDDGYFIKQCLDADELEELRDHLRQSGFLTVGHEQKGEDTSINVFGHNIVLFQGKSEFFIVAKKAAIDPEESDRDSTRKSIIEINRKTLVTLSAKEDLEDPPIDKAEWQAVWAFFLVLAFLVWAVIFIITVEFFDKMRFPLVTGFSNYFVGNMIGIVSSTPVNIIIFMSLMYFRLSRLPRVTSKIVWSAGWTVFGVEFLFGMITTVPLWLINIGFSYYVLARMVGLPVNTFLNGALTGLIVALILRGVYALVFRQKKEPTVIGAKEFEFTFNPAYVSSTQTLKISEASTKESETVAPLHVEEVNNNL